MSWHTVIFVAAYLASGQDAPRVINGQVNALRSFQHDGRTPTAVVQHVSGERDDQVRTVLLFRHGDQGRSVAASWSVRDEGADGRVRTARSEDCSAVFETVLGLERMPLPPLELRLDVDGAPDAYSPGLPNLGRVHSSFSVFAASKTAQNEPVFYRIGHLGAGPIQVWMADTDRRLEPCWRPQPDAQT